MTKFFKYFTYFFFTLCILTACKKDDEGKNPVSDSVRISTFALKADSTNIENLDKVFFTIDLENGLIYNADSLPKGTNVSELKFTLTTENAKEVNND